MSGVTGAAIGLIIGILLGGIAYLAGWLDGWDEALESVKKIVEGVDDDAMLTFAALRALLDVVKDGDGNG